MKTPIPARKTFTMTKAVATLQAHLTTRRPEKGATAVEYGLMVALIAVVMIAAVLLLGTRLSSMFTKVANTI